MPTTGSIFQTKALYAPADDEGRQREALSSVYCAMIRFYFSEKEFLWLKN